LFCYGKNAKFIPPPRQNLGSEIPWSSIKSGERSSAFLVSGNFNRAAINNIYTLPNAMFAAAIASVLLITTSSSLQPTP